MTQAWRAFADVIPLVAAAALIAIPAVILRSRRRVRAGESWRSATTTVGLNASAVVVMLAVLGITLEPLAVGAPATANWVPFATIIDQATSQIDASVAFRNIGLNVALFIPVGFVWTWAAVRSGRSWTAALIAGVGLSLFVELVQLLAPLGRAVDVDDVLLNSCGTLLGALGFWVVSALTGGDGEPVDV